ncbi:MAG TPA: aminotransferase class IV [Candidatus Acidoferrum sp.]|nr:aminotransferase class IV [Candidatus Acidoferrum sp.]
MYTDGAFCSADRPNIFASTQAFNYGTAAFEGMKVYYRPSAGEWYLFRPDLHYARLMRSAGAIDIKVPLTYEDFVEVINPLIMKCKIRSDCYIRPLVYRKARGVGLTRPSEAGISIFVQASPPKRWRIYRCVLVPQRRPTDGSYAIKLSGNYVLSFMAQQEAIRQGADTGILLSSDGYLSEATVMNLFFVSGGRLYTPSLACGALDGITRRSIIELAKRELGIKTIEGKFRPGQLAAADEALLCGTGSGINEVSSFGSRSFDLHRKNRLTPVIQSLYRAICRGRLRGYEDWLVSV